MILMLRIFILKRKDTILMKKRVYFSKFTIICLKRGAGFLNFRLNCEKQQCPTLMRKYHRNERRQITILKTF